MKKDNNCEKAYAVRFSLNDSEDFLSWLSVGCLIFYYITCKICYQIYYETEL